ncbi:hypothetical protein AB832_05370 [Flavobacteriaceae bacterium (ex Bugula neritina AB1)]|nr:hypothetical protein AB832_05370 [Flavobacteriaceae bacterium (ex Bugula neritina AB1)]
MKIRSIVKRFNFWQLIRLAFLMLQRPAFIFPTLYATSETMSICNELYGKAHHKNGVENAFRHALWNTLICKKVYDSSSNVTKSIRWAEKVTDLHEKLAPNRPLATAMDLHNNRIGRSYFKDVKNDSQEEIITFIREQLPYAKFVATIDEADQYDEELVYIER